MSDIRVIPLTDDAAVYARRRLKKRIPPPFSWGYFIFWVLIFIGIGLVRSMPEHFHSRPQAPSLGLLLVAYFGGAIVAIGGVKMASEKYRSMNVAFWGLLFIMYSFIPVTLYRSQQLSYTSFSYYTNTLQPLARLLTYMHIYKAEHGGLPKSLVLLVIDGEVKSEQIIAYNSNTTTADVGIGDLTLDQWENGVLRAEAFHNAADALPPPPTWEQLGDFLLSRDVILNELPETIIVGISPPLGDSGFRWVVNYDGNISQVRDDSGWWAQQNHLRAELGLDPMPARLP